MADTTPGAAAQALTDPGATPTPSPTPSPAAAPSPGATGTTAANDAWYAKLTPENQGWLEKKGWNKPDSLETVVKGYAELERTYRSGDKVVWPKDENDTEAWKALHTKLGVPESAEKYKFPEGVDAEQIKAIAPELHKLGISQTQAEGLAKLDLGRMQQAMEQQQHAWTDDQQKAMDKLNGEWGGKSAEEIEYNRRAMRALGISVEEANVFMRGGSEKFLRLLNLAGRSMREDNTGAMQDDSVLGFGMTGNRAAAEIAEKKADIAFMQRLQKGDKAAEQTWKRLHRIQAGERG